MLERIENHEWVTAVYGDWPSFAGGDLVAANIASCANDLDGTPGRQLTLTLHWWRGAEEHYPDAPRHYDPADLHRRITIVFDAEELTLRTFHCSDTSIDALRIERRGDCLLIACGGGCELSFTSWGAKVLAVDACDESGELLPDR